MDDSDYDSVFLVNATANLLACHAAQAYAATN